MFTSSNNPTDDKGAVLIEFAAFVPVLILAFVGAVELGNYLLQANAVTKGLRMGVTVASRAENPMTEKQRSQVINYVEHGNSDGSGAFLAPGWKSSNAKITIDTNQTVDLDGLAVPVVRIQVSVPYQPFLPGLLDFAGIGNLTIVASHEQAFIGR
jgi:Flp pilus assembly protein TadG